MSDAQDVLAVQLAAGEAASKLSRMLDKVFSEKQILKRSHSNICDVLDNIRKELGVAHNFPKESLPGLIATLRDCRPMDHTVVGIAELLEWISAKGFLSPASISKEALLDTLNRIIERCLNAETDRYNLQQALEQERKKSEDLSFRLNRVGLDHRAAVAQLGTANSRIAHLENNLEALHRCPLMFVDPNDPATSLALKVHERIDALEKKESSK